MSERKQRRKKAPNGAGTIFPRMIRGKMVYVAEVTIGYDENGKRKKKTLYGNTQREVVDKKKKLEADVLGGLIVEGPKLTVARLLEECERTSDHRPSTRVANENIIKKYINPLIGGMSIDKLQTHHIKWMIAQLAARDVSPRMRQYAYAVLHAALEVAMQDGRVSKNVAALMDRPQAPDKTFDVLTPEQGEALLRAAEEDRNYALYVLALTTGMRQGELLALRWQDVDLKAGFLSVRHTLSYVKGKVELGEPKTKTSRRRIDLSMFALGVLKEHRKRMMSDGRPSSFVFSDANGGPLRANNLTQRSFAAILKRAGLPHIRFHDLRHSAATIMLANGVNPKVVSQMLGHADVGFTMRRYVHVLPTSGGEVTRLMDSLFRGGTARDCTVTVQPPCAAGTDLLESSPPLNTAL